MVAASFDVHPVGGSLGAEIRGVDLARMDDDTFEALYRVWLDHSVVFLREQSITPDQQLSLARRFGEIHLHPYMKGMDDHPEILEIVKEPGQTFTFGSVWHTDQMFNPEPAKATLLYALETPRAGGDTLFASGYRAYDTLSDGMKSMVGRLSTVCYGDGASARADAADRASRYAGNASMAGKVQDPGVIQAVHPLARTHPETARRSLYIGGHARGLDGFTQAESDAILEPLREHAVRPEFLCRFSWEPGSIAIWDNRCTQHYAVPDYNERRRMHRVTVKGDKPF